MGTAPRRALHREVGAQHKGRDALPITVVSGSAITPLIPTNAPPPPPPPPLQAQQALSVALNKLGELHHLQGDLAAAAELYQQALDLRRQLLDATRQQWQQAEPAAGSASSSIGGGSAEPASGGEGESQEACCAAALDLAASCLKVAGARRGSGADDEAQVRWAFALGPACSARRMRCTMCALSLPQHACMGALLRALPWLIGYACRRAHQQQCWPLPWLPRRPCCRKARRCCGG